MALPPLLSLRDISLSFGGNPIFQNLSLSLNKSEKICLVGRNGSGKSTLLKILAGLVENDHGERYLEPNVKVTYLPQDVDLPESSTILLYIQQTTDCEAYQAEAILDVLKMNPLWQMTNLSGGERRRVALAQTLVQEPDVLLLDEPTNHLDLPAIEWLEQTLNQFRGALMTISHDRRFLEKVSTSTAWLDRGNLYEHKKGFSDFERWSEEMMAEEERHLDRLNTKLKQEMVWLHRGVTARRRRNQGRLRQLHQLRAQKKDMLSNKPGKLNLGSAEGDIGSKLVIEAKNLFKSFQDKNLIQDFSTRILRGDRIGIIGPNGSGKTTLVKMLVKQLQPDSGHVRLGKSIQLIYFDQLRDTLKPTDTLWEALCEQGGDQVLVQGKPRHVVAYLKDFLFQEKQAHSPISVLSGGEKNRLALAKALTQPGNLLVLDEPTNDLDMDTLDLLQELLNDFEGTLIVVSHDRDFLDKLTTSLIAVEGDGTAKEYIGGYEDYKRQRPEQAKISSKQSEKKPLEKKIVRSAKKLSYNEKREYENLPNQIENLTTKIQQAEHKLDNPNFYQNHPQEFIQLTEQLIKDRQELEDCEIRWLELAEKEESF